MTQVLERMSDFQDPSPPLPRPPRPTDPPGTQAAIDFDALPTLYRDRSFWGMTVTQFMGAFNDGVFKQLVLLLTAQVLVASSGVVGPMDLMGIAGVLFALSFVLFSGVAGHWADRVSKRTIIVGCKMAEMVIMLGSVGAFALMGQRLVVDVAFTADNVALNFPSASQVLLEGHESSGNFAVAGDDGHFKTIEPHIAGSRVTLQHPDGAIPQVIRWGDVTLERAAAGEQSGFKLTQHMPWLLIGVLFLMGTHSAVFGPAKYGILPEMVRRRDLPRFNGMIQMTTFLALIFGTALAGRLLDHVEDRMWMAGLFCLAVAMIGTSTSFLVRRTPVAQSDAKFGWSDWGVSVETREVLKQDRPLLRGLIVYSLFWFVAAVVPLSITALGRNVLGLSDTDATMMVACISIGIAVGCMLAGRLSASRIRFGLVRLGTWGMLICLLLLSCPGMSAEMAVRLGISSDWLAHLGGVNGQHLLGYRGSQVVLALAGLFAGLLAVPLQVFLQARPPAALKGRMIGTMNLINWVLMVFSQVFYSGCQLTLSWLKLPTFFTFGATGLLILLPIALFYRPTDVSLE